MDYFGKDAAWYGGWCRGRRSINCQVRKDDGFCDCVIAELPQACMKGCGRKIHEGDCIAKNGDGWGHGDCESDNSSPNHRKKRRRRQRPEEERDVQQPQLNRDNPLDAILDAISKYRSPSQRSTCTLNSRRSTVQIHKNVIKAEEKDQAGTKPRLSTTKAEIIDKNALIAKAQARPSSEVNSGVLSLPIVTPQFDKKRPREDNNVKPSRSANRRLQFEG